MTKNIINKNSPVFEEETVRFSELEHDGQRHSGQDKDF